MSALTDNVAAAPAAHLQFEDCTGLCACGQCDYDDGTPDAVTQAGEQLLYGLFAFVAAFCFFLIVAP